ncbi:hypothetical protein BG011_004246 [Mortierella polycephala]|uniref:Methyltransferase domain-containing protein n=1 Tax=Mortierella polycephala TaxID=41804 RepID=A0A9P6U2L7_9FUNG|nr:hypothetical protein BG011_004246 [Mortierella polycephala]
MGNNKSRQAHYAAGSQSKSRGKNSNTRTGQDRKRLQDNQQPLLNDSGHYSVHGFTAAPISPRDCSETPVGGGTGPAGAGTGLAWNHPNFSSPGRLDQPKRDSDSSLQIKNGLKAGSGVRPSGTASRTTMMQGVSPGDDGTYGYGQQTMQLNGSHDHNGNNHEPSSKEPRMATHPHQRQSSYQGPDIRPSSASPRQSHGGVSTLQPGLNQQQQQQQQYPHYQQHTSVSPPAVPFTEDEHGMMVAVATSMAKASIGGTQPPQPDQQPNSTTQQTHPNNNPITPQIFRSNPASTHLAKNNTHQHYAYNDKNQLYTQQDYQQQQPSANQPRLTTTYPSEKERPSGNHTKPSNPLAGAGPLIETSSSQRTPTADQVFARLARQFPTNPRETEKRERINRWLDQIIDALTFNPDPETPGWIIPVYPDETDHPETPFYLNRITYELDLMAPFGRPFRKAIDVNCSSGEWAMDMALKYSRTIVYALDPHLETSQLPLRIPENCKFRLRDVRDQEGEFDLVHQRLGAFRIQIQEWTPHFAELRRLTKPGGWIQLAESNGMLIRGGVESLKVNRWVERAALSSGLNPMQLVEALMPTLLGAGLINVECYDFGIPVGEWAGARGQVAMRAYLDMIESLRDEIIDMNRLEEGIFEETVELMKMECLTEQAELIMKVICAQKPPTTDDLWRTR